jgi:histidinol dehydrogenase
MICSSWLSSMCPPPVEETGPQVVVLAKQTGVGQVHLCHGVKATAILGRIV